MPLMVMGIDVSGVPTADLMELAAKLLEVDAGTIAKFEALAAAAVGRPAKLMVGDANITLAAALRERAERVRELETQ